MQNKAENDKSYRAGFIQCARDIQSGKNNAALITFVLGADYDDHAPHWCSGYNDCREWFRGNTTASVHERIGHDYDNFYGQQSFIHPVG